MSWTLSDIRQKVRQVTGRLSADELSNTQLDEYINNYKTLTLPAELKLNYKLSYYELLTAENTQSYDVPTGYTNFVPPATMDRLSLQWYQDEGIFYENNPQKVQRSIAWTGDGATVTFNTTVQQFPILPDSLVITDDLETFEDTNSTWTTANVVISGSLGGSATINYSSGSVSVTFNTAPTSGASIWLSYIQFVAGRPTAVLYYNNQFTFYPVPDTAYRFRVGAYEVSPPLVNATDTPELEQWGPLIAYGAARDIVADYGEMQAYQEITALYKEQLAYVMRRTHQDLLNTRAQPFF